VRRPGRGKRTAQSAGLGWRAGAGPAVWSGRRARPRRLPPAWTITAVLGLVYVILAPPSSDLAAAAYRSNLFARAGFTLWDNSWYGGHHLLAYSVLAPALGALVGPQLLAAFSMTIATALFAALIDGRFPARATRIAAPWFALGAAIALLSNRVPFDLGLTIGLGALLLAQRGRPWPALALALLTSLASPVAGAFLALAFLAWALARRERGWPAALTVAALAPIALLTLAFPEGGSQPFAASAFYPALVGVLLIAALIPADRSGIGQRVLRIGTLLYALALTGSYLLPTAVGSNADRLGVLVGAPLTACLLAGESTIGRRPRLLLALAPLLLYWQANAPVSDFASARSDPAVHSSYFNPLLGELRSLGVGYSASPARIEVVPTPDHWEARFLAPHVMIARGWERQLDQYRNGLFYDESTPLTPARYRAWLSEQAISYVALPDAPLDYSAEAEARLLRSDAPAADLHEIWKSAHWRLFAVLDARPLAQQPAVLAQLDDDSFTLRAPSAGSFTVRVHFSPYWALASGHGCVSRAPGDWTEVSAQRAGSLHVVIRFSLARLFSHGSRCR
jgi:hypothetical protein